MYIFLVSEGRFLPAVPLGWLWLSQTGSRHRLLSYLDSFRGSAFSTFRTGVGVVFCGRFRFLPQRRTLCFGLGEGRCVLGEVEGRRHRRRPSVIPENICQLPLPRYRSVSRERSDRT